MKTKKRDLLNRYIPLWSIVPLVTIMAVNCLIYWGSSALTAGRYHFDFTMAFDREVPLLPVFVWFYILAFPFWAVGYLLAARRGKDMFYRFVATDLTIHFICFICFILIPTTNIRPEIPGNTLSEKILAIHCYVSWMCWKGVEGSEKVPKWYQRFSLVFAILIIISTQVLKQHYIVDAAAALLLVEFFWRFYQKGQRHKWVVHVFAHKKK